MARARSYLLFSPVIEHYNAVPHLARAGNGVFFTHPGRYVSVMHCFVDQIVLAAFLPVGIFAIAGQCDEVAPIANSGALVIGLLVAVVGASTGCLDAWAISPARDLGPRLFCLVAGRSGGAIPSPGHDWRVPIAGPLIGGLIGAGIHQGLVCPLLPRGAKAGTPRRAAAE